MTSHERADSNAKISLSLSKELLAALDSWAEKEGRTRSNMLQRILADYNCQSEKQLYGTRAESNAAESPGEPYKGK